MTGIVQDQAFVSLATNNGYALGALVLGRSLRSVSTNRQLVLMITREIHPQVRQELLRIWDRLVVVNILDSDDTVNLALLRRPDLGMTFTKLHAWSLTEYNKCVFLDADILVLQNVDDMFERPEISAAPDTGWPDCFNSGVFVFVPSQVTHDALIAHALVHGSFDGGDQGLLNSFFNNWSQLGPAHRLPFTYNLQSSSTYTYSPAFKRFGSDVKIVHFLGAKKPWQYSVNLETGQVLLDPGITENTFSGRYLQEWWNIYHEVARGVTGGDDDQTSVQGDLRQSLHIESDSDDSDILDTVTENDENDTHQEQVPRSSPPRVQPIIPHYPEESNNHYEHNHSHPVATQSAPTSSESYEISRMADNIGNLQLRDLPPPQQNLTERQPLSGRLRWEYGDIDYLGVDSFDNILQRLDESLLY